ncbi:hypothetical protein ACRAWD_01965 [Caulobacter segnis]
MRRDRRRPARPMRPPSPSSSASNRVRRRADASAPGRCRNELDRKPGLEPDRPLRRRPRRLWRAALALEPRAAVASQRSAPAQAEPCQDAGLIEGVRLCAPRAWAWRAPQRCGSAPRRSRRAAAGGRARRAADPACPRPWPRGRRPAPGASGASHELAHLRRGDNWQNPVEGGPGRPVLSPLPVRRPARPHARGARGGLCDLTALRTAAAPEASPRLRPRPGRGPLRMSAQPSPAFQVGLHRSATAALVNMRLSAILRPDAGRASAGRVGLAIALGAVLAWRRPARAPWPWPIQARRLAPPELAPAADETAPRSHRSRSTPRPPRQPPAPPKSWRPWRPTPRR